MKKLRLGFVAIALISGISAFATSNKANAEDDCTQTTGNIDALCPFGINACCTAPAESSLTQTQPGSEDPVPVAPLSQIFRD